MHLTFRPMCWSVIHGPSIELGNYRSWISCKEQSSTINTLVNHASHWLENMVISQWHFLVIIVSFFFCTDSFLVFFIHGFSLLFVSLTIIYDNTWFNFRSVKCVVCWQRECKCSLWQILWFLFQSLMTRYKSLLFHPVVLMPL